jgi:plastocyanin
MKRVTPLLPLLGALALVGCGSSKSTSSTAAQMHMTKAQMAAMGTTGATGKATMGVTTTVTPASSVVTLAAAPNGNLMYEQSALSAKAGKVTIDFTNDAPIPHNVTVANAAGKVLGATPTFEGGTKVLTLDLAAGRYTYYCSVPGHEQAGMKGTLTVT